MFSLLKNRFGAPGVVSVIALVLAMAGGAWAAKGVIITKLNQIAPNVQKQLKGKAGAQGPQGLPGAAGAAGAKGDVGSQGSQGPPGNSVKLSAAPECEEGGTKLTVGAESQHVCNGKEGEPGPSGEPWTAGGTLPKGATETGTFAATANAALQLWAQAPFPIPLSAPLDSSHVVFHIHGYDGEDGIGAEHEICPGKALNPKAKEGYLCVYIGIFESPFNGIEGVQIRTPENTQGAGTAGALLKANGETSSAKISGSFAVTGS